MLCTGQAADSLEVRSAKQDLERLLELSLPGDAETASDTDSLQLNEESVSGTQAVQPSSEQSSRPPEDTDHDRTQQHPQ